MIHLTQKEKYFIFTGITGLALIGGLYLLILLWIPSHKQDHLVLYGNVNIRQVDLSFRVGGRIEKMFFEEGDEVKQGDLLAILDKAPFEADFAAAKETLAEKTANFLRFKHGNRPQEIEGDRALVRERQAALEISEITFEREKEEISSGATSKQGYDMALARLKQDKALLQKAKEDLSLAEEGSRQEDIEATRAIMETARARLESAKINLEDTKLHAPAEGIIMTRVAEPATVVGPQFTVYTLTLPSPVWVRAYLMEPELGLVKPGMEVFVFTDTHPDKPFKGQVGFISPQAEFTPKTVETTELRTELVYRIRVTVDDPKGQLRQGMPVTLKIKLGN